MSQFILDSSGKTALSLCRSCSSSSSVVGRTGARYFNSSPRLMVGPESPDYVDVPHPVQTYQPHTPEVKGKLPVPREVFPRRRPDKPTQSYLDDVTKEPVKEPKVKKDHPHYEYLEWKRKMADTRRQNLREGLKELYYRKQQAERTTAEKSRAKLSYRQKIMSDPPRQDEHLTTPSTGTAIRMPKMSKLPNPDAEKRLEESKARVAAKQEAKKIQRQQAIHTLFTRARHFITTEQQLSDEVDKVFPLGENPAWTTGSRPGENIWNMGTQPTVANMIEKMHDEIGKYENVQRRTKKIGEELSGGTIQE